MSDESEEYVGGAGQGKAHVVGKDALLGAVGFVRKDDDVGAARIDLVFFVELLIRATVINYLLYEIRKIIT